MWKKVTGIIAAITSLIGVGYAAGLYQGNIQCTLEKNTMLIDYQIKLSEVINKEKLIEKNEINQKSKSFDKLVEILKESQNAE